MVDGDDKGKKWVKEKIDIDALYEEIEESVDKFYSSDDSRKIRIYINAHEGVFDKLNDYVERKKKQILFVNGNQDIDVEKYKNRTEELRNEVINSNMNKEELSSFMNTLDSVIDYIAFEKYGIRETNKIGIGAK
jgi:hypothetical protein